jgi:superoxide dismutase, Fe-Mn family
MRQYNRRLFLKNSSKATLAAGIGMTILPNLASAANNSPYQQQPLPYSYQALEPFIDAATMEIHYSKHAATYAKNLADACLAEKVNATSVSLESLMQNISKYSAKMRNNGGGHYNHEFFWKCMKPGNGSTPSGKILSSINQSFGSFEAFKTQFSEAAKNRFGSGWAWLIQSTDGTLKCSSTANQDNPLMDIVELKGKPLLALDVWEHAYYLKYQNKRPDYINNWFNLVDWNFVENQLR